MMRVLERSLHLNIGVPDVNTLIKRVPNPYLANYTPCRQSSSLCSTESRVNLLDLYRRYHQKIVIGKPLLLPRFPGPFDGLK